MSEQPLYSYWDEQASLAAAAPPASTPAREQQDDALHQQFQAQYFQQEQQQQQESTSSSHQHITSNMPYGSFGQSNSAGQEDPYHAFMLHLPSLGAYSTESPSGKVSSSSNNNDVSAGAGAVAVGGQNQLAVLQLQQNLMFMLQQQQQLEQSVVDVDDGNVDSTRGRSSLIQQHQQQHQAQQQQHRSQLTANPSQVTISQQQAGNNIGNRGEQASWGNSLDLDSSNLMAHYRHLFATHLEDAAAQASGGNATNSQKTSNNNYNNNNNNQYQSDTISPSSSRLFALGAMVQPLSSSKPEQIISTGDSKAPEISASSLGISESSSDFMMRLFLDESSKLSALGSPYDKSVGIFTQQQQQPPLTVPSAQGITVSDLGLLLFTLIQCSSLLSYSC
jgi:hypothetical protein